jgi:hypothetical protein
MPRKLAVLGAGHTSVQIHKVMSPSGERWRENFDTAKIVCDGKKRIRVKISSRG